MKLSASDFAALTSDERAELAANGVQLNEQDNTLVFPEANTRGFWIKVADRFFMTDQDGLFRIPDIPSGVTSLEAFRSILDGAPEQTFTLDHAGFDADDATAPTFARDIQVRRPGPMNGADAGSHVSDGCPGRCIATQRAAAACCADYDGPLGDQQPRSRHTDQEMCRQLANRNFIGSWCFQWSFGPLGAACLNESAYWCSEGADPICLALFPDCWHNHKYRNCQDMNETEFSLEPQNVTICSGETAYLHIHNNTTSNETLIEGEFDDDARDLSVVGDGSGFEALGAFPVLHYSDAAQRHYVDVTVAYRPSSSSGDRQDVRFTASADGNRSTTTIHIDHGPNCQPADAGIDAGIDAAGTSSTVGGAWGDPHLYTFDHAHYDYQRVGEFVFVNSPSGSPMVIQIRTKPYGSSRTVAGIAALAANVDGDIVEVDAGDSGLMTLLNGAPTGPTALPHGGRLTTSAISWADGSFLAFGGGSFLNVRIGTAPGRVVRGLLGDGDADPGNDYQLRDGTVLTQPLSASDFAAYVEAWRVQDSLFTYGPDQNTMTFTDLTFPSSRATAGGLPADVYASARGTCTGAGVSDPAVLDACILDVGTTGDVSFATAAADIPAADAADPAIHDFAVDPASLAVDRIRPLSLTPDGSSDGAFDATVRGPISGFVLLTTSTAGVPANGQQWDTVPTGGPPIPPEIMAPFPSTAGTFYLGIEENGVLLNNANSSLPVLGPGVHHIKLYASVSSQNFFRTGSPFRLHAILPNQTGLGGPVLVYTAP